MSRLSYAVVTAARNEAVHIPRLAASLSAQTHRPSRWVVVENGSDDGTAAVVRSFAAKNDWIELATAPVSAIGEARSGPIVRALHGGLEALRPFPAIVVITDADISMPADHFERLIEHFNADSLLGLASGSMHEAERGSMRQQYVTGANVHAACRAYRRECLEFVLPFVERIGWVGVADAKAAMSTWRTQVFTDLPFEHHRQTGIREPSLRRAWFHEGDASWYLGYRPSYLFLRTLHRASRDPAAWSMLTGYLHAALHRAPRHPEDAVRGYIRSEQRLTRIPRRIRESRGIGRR